MNPATQKTSPPLKGVKEEALDAAKQAAALAEGCGDLEAEVTCKLREWPPQRVKPPGGWSKFLGWGEKVGFSWELRRCWDVKLDGF